MKLLISCLLFVLPVSASALEIPRTEKEFIARHIIERAKEANIDLHRFLAVAYCESDLNPRAFSRTKDQGIFQINPVHRPTYRQMKIDPYNYADNVSFVIYLYQRSGWSPWFASRKCWEQKTVALSDG